MKPIFNLFWQICLLRQSPAHVPTHGWFVVLVVLANLLCSVLISATLDSELALLRAITAIVVGQTTTAALIYLALALNNRGTRFLTTLTAIFGCDLIMTACYALVMPLSGLWGETAGLVALGAYVVWSVAVAGFILHRALDAPLAVGIGVAMAIALMSGTMGQLAIGAPAST